MHNRLPGSQRGLHGQIGLVSCSLGVSAEPRHWVDRAMRNWPIGSPERSKDEGHAGGTERAPTVIGIIIGKSEAVFCGFEAQPFPPSDFHVQAIKPCSLPDRQAQFCDPVGNSRGQGHLIPGTGGGRRGFEDEPARFVGPPQR